jgi:hypothetical protein
MTLNWGSRAAFQPILLLSLSHLAASVSLQDLQFHASALEALRPSCNQAYKATISDCTNDDFSSGCSNACVQGVMQAVDNITKQCSSLLTSPVALPVLLPVPLPIPRTTTLNSKDVVNQVCSVLATVGTTSTTSSTSATPQANTSPTASTTTTSTSSLTQKAVSSGTMLTAATTSAPAAASTSPPAPLPLLQSSQASISGPTLQQPSILVSTSIPATTTLQPLILPHVSLSSSSDSTITTQGTLAPFPVSVQTTMETSTSRGKRPMAPSPSHSSSSSIVSKVTSSTTSSPLVQASMEPKTLPPIDNPQAEFASKTTGAGGVIAAVAGSISGVVLIVIFIVFGCLYRRQRLRTLRPLYARDRPATENLTFLRYQPPVSSFYESNLSGVVFPSSRRSMPLRRDSDPFHPFQPFRPTSRPSPLFARQAPPQYRGGVRISLSTSDLSFRDGAHADQDSPFKDPGNPFQGEITPLGGEISLSSNQPNQIVPPLPTPGGASSTTETSASTGRLWELLGDPRREGPGVKRGRGQSA